MRTWQMASWNRLTIMLCTSNKSACCTKGRCLKLAANWSSSFSDACTERTAMCACKQKYRNFIEINIRTASLIPHCSQDAHGFGGQEDSTFVSPYCCTLSPGESSYHRNSLEFYVMKILRSLKRNETKTRDNYSWRTMSKGKDTMLVPQSIMIMDHW